MRLSPEERVRRSRSVRLHLIVALRDAEQELAALHRRLMQGTYFAVPDKQLTL